MNNTKGRLLNIAMACTLVLGIIFLTLWIKSAPPTGTPRDSAESSASAESLPDIPKEPTPTPQIPNTLLEYLPAQEEEALKNDSTKFLQAYTQRIYTDPSPTSWLGRAKALATTHYADQLEQNYGGGSGGAAWTEFISTKSQTTLTIVELKVIRTDHIETGKAQTMMTFDIETTTGDGTITAAPLRFIKILSIEKTADTWRVASLDNPSGDPAYMPTR
ncbi:hypothetical protein [Arthrobacter glacialis]|uniref:Uncharacterized protein n=1 Tax=Arthrobacter glacialis TaxID=1664 RepID=A0A2S3ZTF6_ARTGL|nr:hypothetical protein [Arthrobacter glacialis]POH72546.1 hypothetical protein CVS27_15615 [Arthrobacter glacialis]